MNGHDRTEKASGQKRLVHKSRPGKGQNGKSGKIPVAKLIITDVLVAALLLNAFALYYFILPRDLSGGAQQLPEQRSAGEAEAVQESAADAEIFSSIDATADTQAEPEKDTSWAEKFAGKFTGGAVEQTENSYRSGNISIGIEKVERDGVTYYVADIYLKDIKYFRTAFAKGTFGSGIHAATDVIAEENGAVLAINGDYSGSNAGPVVRNGVLYRDEVYQDALVMYNDGSMQAFSADEMDMDSLNEAGVWQVWTFGPMLLKDGQPMETFNSTLSRKNPRTAVGYYEPGHYCFVVVDGRQPGYSEGYTLKEMSQLFYELGCKAAFNLDGGQSSGMAFMGEFVNRPYNGGRGTSDIVYIADD